jgi:putative NADH-flavin reductase
MRVLVFGPTGGTGLQLLTQALDRGHGVVAFARDPAKLDDMRHDRLEVIRGDVFDRTAVERAVAGTDAVLCAVGAGPKRTTLRENATRNIVDAMENSGPRRLICLSSLGVGDSRGNLSLFTKYVIVGLFLRHAFADHERQEAIVRASHLDWTIVRPPHLRDGPQTGTYQRGFAVTDRQIAGEISRADVADFMLEQLTDETYHQQAVGVSY